MKLVAWSCGLLLLLSCRAASGETRSHIPAARGETFAGGPVALPEALGGRPGVLVIGFTQGSRDAVTLWGRRLAREFPEGSAVSYYEVPMLASVPRLLRGLVAGRIGAAVAVPAKAHVLPLFDHEAEWRAVAGYNAPDDAYVLLVDGDGGVRWRMQGAVTDAACALLQQQLLAVTAPPTSRMGR